MVFWHYLSTFSKTLVKNEVSKCMLNVAYWLKTLKILVPAFHKIVVSTKTKYFDTFCLYFLDNMNPSYLNILNSSQLQAKHLVIPQKNEEENSDNSI